MSPIALLVLALFSPSFDEDDEVPEVIVGGRLFLETRFAQHFFAHAKGRMNGELPQGDPVMERSVGLWEDLPGPFAGRSMNCRACHLVNEHQKAKGGSLRAYTDLARRSPIPGRGDGETATPRRSPILVNATLPRSAPMLLHYDGEFTSIEELVRGTLTGRNFGWRPDEAQGALRHIADVIRRDDGSDLFARKTAKFSYAALLRGTDPAIPPFVRIPEEFRLDVAKAGDEEILGAVARLIGAYVDSLRFAAFLADQGALYSGSPYDAFLVKNGLPRRPDEGESEFGYARRLRDRLDDLTEPRWISDADWSFKLHNQAFQFGPRQLEGLRIFLSEPSRPGPRGRVGNCVGCHTPPAFSDFMFHNNGAAQEEYDALHGAGAFAALEIPTLARRSASPDRFLPASAARPKGTGVFRSAASASAPGRTDLGLWNVFANDAIPGPQEALRTLLGSSAAPGDEDLAGTIALFKTPTVRDLGQSGPYFHTGRKDGIEAVLRHYVRFPELARSGLVRNADPKLAAVTITEAELDSLQSFLRSLNEDYND